MRVIVAGGRAFVGDNEAREWLISKLQEVGATEVVSGCAKGADTFGEKVAESIGLPVAKFPARWKEYGRSAGPVRNAEMAEYADACILFPGGAGTIDMEMKALRKGLSTIEYKSPIGWRN